MKLRNKVSAIALSALTAAVSLAPTTAMVFSTLGNSPLLAQVPDVLGTLTLGVVLQNALDRVETDIRAAGEAGRGIAVQAGTEAYQTIQSAKVAYADSLDLTVDKLDTSTTRKLQEIKSMTDALESKADDQVSKTASLAQQITNTLPLANTTPQLTSYSPKFVTSSNISNQVEIEMKGNFVFAQKPEYRPSLKIGETRYDPVENTTQSIKFLVPASQLLSDANRQATPNQTPPIRIRIPGRTAMDETAKRHEITLRKATLSIPYREGLPLLETSKAASYDLLLGVLPPNPGKIVFFSKVTQQKMLREHVVTQAWQQHSSNDDIPDAHYEGPPEDLEGVGWKIDPSSVRFVVDWSQGDENDQWSKSLVRSNPSIVFRVNTVHHRFGTSGKVNFHFEYDRFRSTPEETWQEIPIALNWGESKSLTANPNEWKVRFTSFEGQTQEFVGAGLNRYLKVDVVGKNVVLAAPAPKEIKG